MTTITCDGCGKQLPAKDRFHLPVVRVEIAPGRQVSVCRSSRYANGTYAKSGCLDKARKAALACPGCGEEWDSLGVCGECRRRIDQARQAETEPLKAVGLYFGRLMPYLDSETHDRLGNLLTRLAQGRGARAARHTRDLPDVSYGGRVPEKSGYGEPDIFVELTDAQKTALTELAEEILALMQAQWRAGYNEGHNALRSLAIGRTSTDDYYDDRAKRSRH